MDSAAFNKARCTNRPGVFLDGRRGCTREARRWQDIYTALANAAGGLDVLDELARLDLRRAASLCLLCEIAEQDLANGKSVDGDVYLRLTSTLGRVLRRLGLGDDDGDLWNPARVAGNPGYGKIFSAQGRRANGTTHP